MANYSFPFVIDQTLLGLLDGFVSGLGSGATPPYSSNLQPPSIFSANNNTLLQFSLPGGASIQGQAGPGAQSIGASINSLMGIFSPFISAYAMILPIIGVIRGLIEIMCALMNPFALASAIGRLFSKYIPSFLSLFPVLAGVLIIINIIKILIAVSLYVVTVVIPTLELIKDNIETLSKLGPQKAIKQKAIKDKISFVLAELANQLAILGVVLPIVNLVQDILALVAGKPCDGGQVTSSKSTGQLLPNPFFNPSGDDATCCGTDVCPTILTNPPSGSGLLEPTIPLTGFTFKLFTNNATISELVPYFINVAGQSNGTINEPVPPPLDITDSASLSVKLTTSRGLQIVVPILNFADNNQNLILSTALGSSFVGNVKWEIVPNYNILIFKNIISLACSPDIASARDAINNAFPDLQVSVLDKFPDLATFNTDFANYASGIQQGIASLTPTIDEVNALENNIITNTDNFITKLKGQLSNIIAGSADKIHTGLSFKVTPNEVKADGISSATISITISDITGAKLSANIPSDISIPVIFETDLGVISNNTLNSTTGEITAQITSGAIGVANIKARVNGVYVVDYDTTTQQENISIRTINFTGDTELPARRFVNQGGNKVGNSSTKEPGK